MNININKNYLKHTIVISSLLASVFLFMNRLTFKIPMLESFLESSSFSVSFFTLPALIEENALNLIVRLSGKTTALMVILLCGVLKYLCILAVGFSLYGTWEAYSKKKRLKFFTPSTVISLTLNTMSLIVIIVVNILLSIYSSSISNSIGFTDSEFTLRFIPTVWLILSFVSSVISAVGLYLYNKE